MKDDVLTKINLKNPIHLLAIGFGSGLAPFAPGTFGTLAAIPFYLLLSLLPWSIFFAFVCLSAIGGCYLCGKTAKDMQVHDHGSIVFDEFVGFWIAMLLVPTNFITLFVGFLLFRIFDIIKPWPISYLDRNCIGGFGIMIDDILAGFIVMIIMYFCQPFFI